MSSEGPTDERSALAWIMSGTVGVLVVGGLAKHLIDKRRAGALNAPESPEREIEPEPDAAEPAGD